MTVKDMKGRRPTSTQDQISSHALASSAAQLIPAGTPIVATRMALGRVVRPLVDVAINQDLKGIFLATGVSNSYFEYWWRSIQPQLEKMGKGTTVMGIRLADINNLEFPLPPSREQERIAAKLDSILARHDQCEMHFERIPGLLSALRMSILEATQRLAITQSQSTTPLGELARFIDYRGKTPRKTESGVPLITAKNVRDGYLDQEPREFISEVEYQTWMTRGFPKVGDVLVTTEAPLGNVVEITWNYKIALAQRLICLAVNPDELRGDFLEIILRSPWFRGLLQASSTGSTVAGIKAARLKLLAIPVPSLEVQARLAFKARTLLKMVDLFEARISTAKTILGNVTPALLVKAFRGELVPQDPADEPAPKLFERIELERASGVSQISKKPKKVDPEPMKTLAEKIQASPEIAFNSEQLRIMFDGPYDAFREELFNILISSTPILRQRYDTEMRELRFVKVSA
jgi:type I restriction enzyme S subunit